VVRALGGEERLEDLRQKFGRDARSGIADGERDEFAPDALDGFAAA
jgi:hypothetical protein